MKQNEAGSRRKPTNVTVNTQLLQEARRLKINLSATLERALELEVREARRKEWLENNRRAIQNTNAFVEKHGLFSDHHRTF